MVDFTLLFFFLVGTYVGAKDVRDIILKPLYNDVSMQVSKKGFIFNFLDDVIFALLLDCRFDFYTWCWARSRILRTSCKRDAKSAP